MGKIGLYFYLNFAKKLQSFNILDLGGERPYTDDISLDQEVRLFAEQYLGNIVSQLASLDKGGTSPIAGMLISGVSFEHLQKLQNRWRPLQQLFIANKLSLMIQPYYRSLNMLLSREQLEAEVKLMQAQSKQFLQSCNVFANTALIYHDFLAFWAQKEGFKLIVAPSSTAADADKYIHRLYHPPHHTDMRILIEDQALAHFCMQSSSDTEAIVTRLQSHLHHESVIGLGIDLVKICQAGQFQRFMEALRRLQQSEIAEILSPEQLIQAPAHGGQLSSVEAHTAFGLSPEEVWFQHELQREAWLSLKSKPEIAKDFPYLQEEHYLRSMAPQAAGDQQHLRMYRHFRTIVADINLKNSNKSS